LVLLLERVSVDEDEAAELTHRCFRLTNEATGQSKTVHHLQYVGWADHAVPPSSKSLHNLLFLAHSLRSGSSPLFIHCSAGVGRTGTFITLDHLFFHVLALLRSSPPKDPKYDPVFETVDQLRQQRVAMVQTLDQYCFIYQLCKEELVER